ncbi:MAG TPA: hypothetical protein VGB38_05370 [bacterium]
MRCNSCILIETYPGIEFNDKGQCTYCASHTRKQYHGEEVLRRILERQRSKNQPYDAVVGISGGRDSAYVLHYLVRVAKMKVLGYFLDNGLVPDTAIQNLKNMTEALGVDMVVERNSMLKPCLKNNFEAWIKKPNLSFIMLTCTICNGGIEIGLRKTAKKRGISLVVTGAGGVEEAHFKNALVHMGTHKQRKNHLSLILGILNDIFRNPTYCKKPPCLYAEGRTFLYQYLPWPIVQRVFYSGQTKIDFFDYIPFDEKEIHRVIETELNWHKMANVASPWRFDCKLAFLKNWMFMELFNFSEKDDLFSSMIREGLMTREQALTRVVRDNVIPLEVVLDACKASGLDFERIKKATHQLRMELEANRKTKTV